MEYETKNLSVPYIVHEADMARAERRERRKDIIYLAIILCLIFALISSWFFFWDYESQFVDEQWTIEANAEGEGDAIANGNGEVNYYGEG